MANRSRYIRIVPYFLKFTSDEKIPDKLRKVVIEGMACQLPSI